MNAEYLAGAAVALLLAGYLIAALALPQRF